MALEGRYPLDWPDDQGRIANWAKEDGARFKRPSITTALDGLERELNLMGAGQIRVTSNLVLNKDGSPRSSQAEPLDCGIAIYFRRKGKEIVLACDKFGRCADNIRALALGVESIRRLERYGLQALEDKVWAAMEAPQLPANAGQQAAPDDWWSVLGVNKDAPMEVIRAAYRALAFKHAPDRNNGDESMARKVNAAMEAATAERGSN